MGPERGLGRHDRRPRPARARAVRGDPGLAGAVMSADDSIRPAAQEAEPAAPAPPRTTGGTIAGLVVLVALAALVRLVDQTLPAATKGSAIGGLVSVIEYPVYAIIVGLLGNL